MEKLQKVNEILEDLSKRPDLVFDLSKYHSAHIQFIHTITDTKLGRLETLKVDGVKVFSVYGLSTMLQVKKTIKIVDFGLTMEHDMKPFKIYKRTGKFADPLGASPEWVLVRDDPAHKLTPHPIQGHDTGPLNIVLEPGFHSFYFHRNSGDGLNTGNAGIIMTTTTKDVIEDPCVEIWPGSNSNSNVPFTQLNGNTFQFIGALCYVRM